jgi:hypothetical protein
MAVTIIADWKLEEVGGKTFGVSYIHWSELHDDYDFEQGFALPDPTNIRVAAQSLILALQSVQGVVWLNPKEDTVILATKHKFLYEILTERMPVWINKWPKSQQRIKMLAIKCYNLLEQLKGFVTLVYIEREENDEAVVDLDENRTEEGFDMEGLTKKGATKEEMQRALEETRMRGVMAQKLLSSGARCYRPRKKTV